MGEGEQQQQPRAVIMIFDPFFPPSLSPCLLHDHHPLHHILLPPDIQEHLDSPPLSHIYYASDAVKELTLFKLDTTASLSLQISFNRKTLTS